MYVRMAAIKTKASFWGHSANGPSLRLCQVAGWSGAMRDTCLLIQLSLLPEEAPASTTTAPATIQVNCEGTLVKNHLTCI